jgi:L-threonylcarbamoyladenylate synthase
LSRKPDSSIDNSRIRRIDPDQPDPSLIREAAHILASGGLIIFPTRGLYGIGADAFNVNAVRRVFAVKHRPAEKPLSVLIPSRSLLTLLVDSIPEAAVSLMDRFWPGRVTLVFVAGPKVPSVLTGKTGKIGIRLPSHSVAAALVHAAGRPMTGTSANLSGRAAASRIADIPFEILGNVELILDTGPLKGGLGSTVVDITVRPPRVLREGGVSVREIFDAIAESRS